MRHALIHLLPLLVAAALLAIPAIAAPGSDDWAPPLNSISRHPMRLALADPVPASAFPSSGKTLRFTPQLEYASFFNWEQGRQLPAGSSLQMSKLDGELAVLGLTADVSIPRLGLTLGGRFDLHHYARGFLDDELSAYHRALGLPNLGREDQPSDRFSGDVLDENGVLAWRTRSGGVKGGNLQLWGSFLLYGGYTNGAADGFGLALRTGLRLPTGSGRYGMDRGSTDWWAGLLATWRQPSWAVDVDVDWVMPGEFDFGASQGYGVRDWVKVMVSGQVKVSEGIWGIGQLAVARPPFSTPVKLSVISEVPVLLSFGAALETGGGLLVFSMSEDLTYSEIDFTVSAGFTFGF